MSIAQYLSKFALGVSSQGVLSAAKGGTGTTTGGGGSFPTITDITYSGDDTATDPAGGGTVTLTGTNFNVGAKVLINTMPISVVTRTGSTQLSFTAPAMAVGSYILYVVNTDGSTAIAVPGIQYSGTPTWTTAAGSLGDVSNSAAVNLSVAATGDGSVTYSVSSGTLPSGLSLNSSTGAITGIAPNPANTTTYNFTIRATDAQNQDTDRSFSLNVVVVNSPTTVDYLVVGGGGGGGDTAGGGGGAGGYRTSVGTSGSTNTFTGGGSPAEPAFSVTPGVQYTVTVGAGGTRFNDATSNSVFGTITSKGGGGGDWDVGGSGGGSSGFSSTTYASGTRGGGSDKATSGQGCRGGAGFYGGSPPPYTPGGGGGGGGAYQAGANGYYWSAGAGGNGIESSITGTATYYAGGGGGGASAYGSGGAGGAGGGGAGAINSPGANGTAGTPNTGGGGGGGHGRDNDFAGAGYGANGGSGIVVIRYSDAYAAAASTTGSPTITVANGYRVYKFTSSGSITF